MVKGLDTFKRYFANYTDCYILIGGSACDVNFSAAALPFRVTHDLDMVLCVEALTSSFFKRFWSFVHEGGYVHREKSNGERQFYRFTHPTQSDYPDMLELFARRADVLLVDTAGHLTPILAGEEASSLSGILLNDVYYDFVMANRTEIDGVSVIAPVGLMALKAIAWLDLTKKKEAGESHAYSKDISKHKNDIARLTVLTAGVEPVIPDGIRAVMSEFMSRYNLEALDTAALRLPFGDAEVKAEIRRLFGILMP